MTNTELATSTPRILNRELPSNAYGVVGFNLATGKATIAMNSTLPEQVKALAARRLLDALDMVKADLKSYKPCLEDSNRIMVCVWSHVRTGVDLFMSDHLISDKGWHLMIFREQEVKLLTA